MSQRPFLQRVLAWSGPLLLLLCLGLKIAEWHTDWLWFEAASYGAQFTRLTAWRAGAFAAGSAVFALWLGGNAHLAWRNTARGRFSLFALKSDRAPGFIALEEKLLFDRFRRNATVFTVALLSWLVGLGCAARYTTFLHAFYGQSLGQADSASGYDLSFFLFQIPLWHLLSRFFLLSLVCAFLVVLAIYLYEEALGLMSQKPLVQASRHLAALWAALLLWRGAACLLSIPEGFVNSGNVATRVFDAVDIRLGWTSSLFFALSAPLLALSSSLAIARQPRPRTFLLGLGWFVAAGNLPFLLPLVTGHSAQNPQWREAITRHLSSTRRAWSLDAMQRRNLVLPPNSTFREVGATGARSDAAGASSVAIWPSETARAAMNSQLKTRNVPLWVPRVWLERADGSLHYVGLASSTILAASSSAKSWRERRSRTGDGEVLRLSATRVSPSGQAVFAPISSIQFLFGLDEPPSEAQNGSEDDAEAWVVSKAPQSSLNGVALQNPLARLTLAARFLDWRLALAPQGNEKLLWHRGAAARCAQIAPFLDWSAADARPLVLKNASSSRVIWLVPGLVWSDDFPDSATPAATGTSPHGVNYGRQAAVGMVDGLSGQVSLFSLDEDEPYLALYRRAFPDLFAPLTSLPNPIRAALRPSSKLLGAQALIWTRYHETDPIGWAARRHDWRFLLPVMAPDGNPFQPLAPQNQSAASPQWSVLPLASALGQAGAEGAASPLVALLGADESDFAARRGRVAWTQWQAATPISLPDAVAQPVQKRVSPRLTPLSPTFVTVAPQFEGARCVAGLWVASGEPDELVSSLNPATSAASRREAPRLQTKWWLLGSASGTKTVTPQLAAPRPRAPIGAPTVPVNEKWAAARSAWRDLRSARQKGDWSAVFRAEKRLDEVLRAP